jgi:hypothetical protein
MDTHMRMLVTVLAIIVLNACTARVKPAAVEVSTPGVVIDSGNSDFCPPGQAKKARC